MLSMIRIYAKSNGFVAEALVDWIYIVEIVGIWSCFASLKIEIYMPFIIHNLHYICNLANINN